MIPEREQLTCVEPGCGKTFPRSKSKGYRAKYCPEHRGKHLGRPAASVTSLPVGEGISIDWHVGPDVSKAEIIKLGRKLAREILVSPTSPMEDKLSVLRIAGRWDDSDDVDEDKRREFQKMIAMARGGAK